MALTTAFDIARRALTAQETAIGVVANNIANVNTPGYTRQQAELVPDRATISSEGLLVGRGVHIDQIRQVIDPLIEKRLVRAQAEQAGLASRRDELQKLAAVLGDVQEPSLSELTDKFFDSVDALARNPDGLAERENVLGTARALAGEFNRRSDAAATLQRTVDDRYVEIANQGNISLASIAQLNGLIVTRESTGAKANDLRDQRSLALTSLAQKLGLNSQEAENGAIRVTARDGTVLVEGGQVVHSLSVQTAGAGLDGNLLHSVGFSGPGNSVITSALAFEDGQLGKLAQVRDSDIPTAVANLDTVALSLKNRVNAVQTTGYDLDGLSTAGQPLFAGTGAGDLSVAITDLHKIGAGQSTERGDNRNALAISDLRNTAFSELNAASFSVYLAVEQGRIGGAASLADDESKASALVTTQLQAERNELSGVNLNEELVNLLRFQRAFQAAAQVVNVSNTTLDVLINLGR